MPSFLAQAAVSMAWLDCAPPVVNTTSAPLRLASASRNSSLRTLLPPRLLLQIGRSSLSFELPLSFEQAAAYRKANGQYVRKNQWRDTTVRVFIDLD